MPIPDNDHVVPILFFWAYAVCIEAIAITMAITAFAKANLLWSDERNVVLFMVRR